MNRRVVVIFVLFCAMAARRHNAQHKAPNAQHKALGGNRPMNNGNDQGGNNQPYAQQITQNNIGFNSSPEDPFDSPESIENHNVQQRRIIRY